MMTEADFYGGAQYVQTDAGTITLHRRSPRVLRVNNLGGGGEFEAVVRLPPESSVQRADKRGGPWFYILCDAESAVGLSVRRADSTVLVSVAVGAAAEILLGGEPGAPEWKYVPRTIGAASPRGSSARAAVASPAVAPVYSPFCFSGTACEYLKSLGHVPLDGTHEFEPIGF